MKKCKIKVKPCLYKQKGEEKDGPGARREEIKCAGGWQRQRDAMGG